HPGGGLDEAVVHLTDLPLSIVMKGFALSRNEAKDAYDIYYMTKYYPGGIEELVQCFQPYLTNVLVRGGLQRIREKFRSPEHIGPKNVADEIEEEDGVIENRRDAFEQVNALLEKLGIL